MSSDGSSVEYVEVKQSQHKEHEGADSFGELRVSYRKQNKETSVMITICSITFIALFAAYLWFLLRVYLNGGASSYDTNEPSIAVELLELPKINELNSTDDKRTFIEKEFNSRLAKYNGTADRLIPFHDVSKLSKNPKLNEFAKLYEEFVQKYNIFLDSSRQSKGNSSYVISFSMAPGV